MPPLRERHPEDEILTAARRRLLAVIEPEPDRWMLVDVHSQGLLVVEDGVVRRRFGVSTAAAGIDGREGSFGTPPGVHRVARKIGSDMELGTWFRSREPVGRWQPGGPQDREDLILSRILTLRGCEPGVNRGEGCDSEARFIYIHGTNHEDRIGEPVSHGCIRMSNTDVIHLFDHVSEGDPVVVV